MHFFHSRKSRSTSSAAAAVAFQPTPPPSVEILLDRSGAAWACGMGEVETHRLQELEVDFGAGLLAEFDLRVAGDAAKDEPCDAHRGAGLVPGTVHSRRRAVLRSACGRWPKSMPRAPAPWPRLIRVIVLDERLRVPLRGAESRSRSHPTSGCHGFTRQPAFASRCGTIRKALLSLIQAARSSRSKVRRTLPESSRKPTLTISKLSGCL